MAPLLLLGLGLALVMSLGGGGSKTPDKLPLPPKRDEDLPDLDIAPYAYAQTQEPGGAPGDSEETGPALPGGSSEDALAAARDAGLAERDAGAAAAAAGRAEENAARAIEAARQEGLKQAAAAHQATERAHAEAAAAAEREVQARHAAEQQHAAREAAERTAEEQRQRADAAHAEAQRLAAEGQAAAAQAAEEASRAAEERANAAIAAAEERAEQEKQAMMAAAQAENEKREAQAREAESAAREQAAAEEAGRKAAEAAQAAERAHQEKIEAQDRQRQENIKKQQAAEIAKQKAQQEAEAKKREALQHAALAKQKQQEASARAADALNKKKQAIMQRSVEMARKANEQAQAAKQAQAVSKKEAVAAQTAAKQSAAKTNQAVAIDQAQDLEAKRVTVASLFAEAVDRRQEGVSTLPMTSRDNVPKPKVAPKPKPSVTTDPNAQKLALIKRYRDAVVNYAKNIYQSIKKTALTTAARDKIDNEFLRIMLRPAGGTGAGRISEMQLMAFPVSMLQQRLRESAIYAEQEADRQARSGTPNAVAAYNAKWPKASKDWAKASVVLRQIPATAVSGYDFVGAVNQRNETRQESTNVVASHFRRQGIDLGKPDPKKAFWRLPLATIRAKSIKAANTIPLPPKAQKPAPVQAKAVAPIVKKTTVPKPAAKPVARPVARPIAKPVAKPVTRPAAGPTKATAATLETNRVSISNAFKAAVAKRKKAFPKEAAQAATNKVAAYFTKQGIPLNKPNAAKPHPLHAGVPSIVRNRLAAIVNAYKPTSVMGVGTYYDFYGAGPRRSSGSDNGGGFLTLGGWAS